jgi:hypothetical protein
MSSAKEDEWYVVRCLKQARSGLRALRPKWFAGLCAYLLRGKHVTVPDIQNAYRSDRKCKAAAIKPFRPVLAWTRIETVCDEEELCLGIPFMPW